jgi:hypothetical protein
MHPIWRQTVLNHLETPKNVVEALQSESNTFG